MVYKFDKGDCSVGDDYNVWVGGGDKDFVWYGGGGFSSALKPGRSASTRASGSPDLMPSTRNFRAMSWCTYPVVRLLDRQTRCVAQWDGGDCREGDLESTLILHLLRLSGVGRVSDPALTRKESCPVRRPAWMRPHTLFLASSSVIARNLCCMVSWFSLLFQVSTLCSLYTFLHWLVICLLPTEDTEFLAPKIGVMREQ